MLLSSICKCGKLIIPLRHICPACRNKMEKIELKNKGIVYSFTISYSPPDGFQAPLSLVIVELEKNAKLICEARDKMKIGDRVLIEKEGEKYYAKRTD